MGKWIGAVIGLIGGPAGAVIGFFIGAFFDAMFKDSPSMANRQQQGAMQQVFFQTLYQCLGHLAKADGQITEAEVKTTEALMTRMGLSAEKRREAIALFKSGASDSFNLDSTLTAFRMGPGQSRQMRQFLIVSLISLGMADGHMDEIENRVVQRIAQGIGMSQMQLQQLIMMLEAQHNFFRGRQQGGSYQRSSQTYTAQQDVDTAYRALGVESSASDAEIKKVYRNLMKEYHPDKLMAKGLPENMVKVATEKAQEIQAAYDLIKMHRKR